MSTRGVTSSVTGSNLSPTSVTSPTCRPKKVTGAPTDSPRSGSLKYSTKGMAMDSGRLIAVARSLERLNTRVRGGRLGRRQEGGCVERESARQQGHQRLGAHVESVRPERDVDSAGVPEARPGLDVLVVGRVDEHLELDRLPVRGEVVGHDLADLQAAVVDRGTDAQRAQVAGLEQELPAAHARR